MEQQKHNGYNSVVNSSLQWCYRNSDYSERGKMTTASKYATIITMSHYPLSTSGAQLQKLWHVSHRDAQRSAWVVESADHVPSGQQCQIQVQQGFFIRHIDLAQKSSLHAVYTVQMSYTL